MIQSHTIQRKTFKGRRVVLMGLGKALMLSVLLSSCGVLLQAASINVPDGFASVLIGNNGLPICPQTFNSSASCVGGTGSASASIVNNMGGSAQVSLGASSTESGTALAEYSIAIQGPSGVNVPVIINGVTATSDGGSNSLSLGVAYYSIGQFAQFFSSSYGCQHSVSSLVPCVLSGGSFTLNETLASQTLYLVSMSAQATPGTSGASAMIDPLIEIDPSFALANEFSLVASAGVLPSGPSSSASPEPGALGMVSFALLVGVLLIGRLK